MKCCKIHRCKCLFVYLLLAIAFTISPAVSSLTIAGMNYAPSPSSSMDLDDDGLLNDDELIAITDPVNPDSDGDSILDGVDPDVLSNIIKGFPGSAFKSFDEGLRTAILSQLENNERLILGGKIDKAVKMLNSLRKHMDGCPGTADKDDWIIDCGYQEIARRFIDILIRNHSSYAIDNDIEPEVPILPGISGGPDRSVGVAAGPDGERESFVLNEVILRTESQEELTAFLNQYSGVILRDGTPTLLPGSLVPADFPDFDGSFLIQVDSALSSLDDLAANMEKIGIRGSWFFSSEEAARTASLVAREHAKNISLNFTMELAQQTVNEHPDDAGGHLNAATWEWMTEDDDPIQPDDQGLSIGVIHAWEYVKYKGYPPSTPYYPVKVAIIDAGFDLDEFTGEPLYGVDDFPSVFQQFDAIDNDLTAGGLGYGFPNCVNGCWHGQLSFGVCCALSQNGYGTAGTSGGWGVNPLVMKVTGDIDTVTKAILNALYNGADVIYDAAGFECGWWCKNFGGGGDDLEQIVKIAKSMGAIFVTPSNNYGKDISNSDQMPCNCNGALCVGAVVMDENNAVVAAGYSNWGTIVDTWAPTNILSTITRDSAAKDDDDIGKDELYLFGGTSASGPYLAGIVALMKMVNPDLNYDQVRNILIDTSNPSNDEKVKDRGYVDAFRAVEAANPNFPPVVAIAEPANNATESYSDIFFKAQVLDPEVPSMSGIGTDFSSTIEFSSNLDGFLCSASGDATDNGTTLSCGASSLSIGTHTITATVTDPFGGIGKDIITIAVINTLPTAKITYPADNVTYYSNQPINLRGYAFDEDVYGYIPLSWSSSIIGPIGNSGDFWVTLPEGDHTITLMATDEKNGTASDSIVIHVLNASGGGGYPAVKITQPSNNTYFPIGTLITFSGEAYDPEDGEILTDEAYEWFSHEDGFLGTGKTLHHELSVIEDGESNLHIITLEVTDSSGNRGSHSINVYISNLQ